ncbi:uncharacterized protein LOC122267916 [Penaeus japonicus]|uniref:uncharacterized protein LOC122267916 n=1 Tax=Penaeus japonicus TaxID=27405 RepID=UPI001C70DFA5|nr:uncharacterized protein LOC122267916 [Penaeus japonicus]
MAKQRFFKGLVVRWMLLTLLGGVCSAKYTALKGTAPGCNQRDEALYCDVSNYTTGAKFDTDNWEGQGIRKITVVGAQGLLLLAQRSVTGITWTFNNCSGVTVDDPESSALEHLRVSHSNVTRISQVEGVLRGDNSNFEKVNIDTLHQFDFVQSKISDLKIRATQKKSTIDGSQVDVVSYLEVHGSFLFEIMGSHIKEIKKLIFSTSDNNSHISDTKIGAIGRESFEVHGKRLLIENVTFTSLASRAFLVHSSLVVRDSQIQRVESDSFVLEEGSITFENVIIGDKNISFAIDRASGGLLALALILPQSSNAGSELAIGIPLSLIFGLLCGVGLAWLILRWKKQSQKQSQDNMELLLSTKESIPTVPSMPPPPTPTPQHESIQEDKDLGDDEIYEEYDEVTNQVPAPPNSVNLLPGSNARNFPRPSDNLSPAAGLRSNGAPPIPSPSPTRLAPPNPPRRGNNPAPQLPAREGPLLPSNLPPSPFTSAPPAAPLPPPTEKSEPHQPVTLPKSLSAEDDNDQEVYDEVSEQVPTPPPAAQRPPIPGNKPSFLHRGDEAKRSLSPNGAESAKPRFRFPGAPKVPSLRGPGSSAGPAAPGDRVWGKPHAPQWPPATPSKPPPPPTELKPSSGSASVEDDDEAIYETVPE